MNDEPIYALAASDGGIVGTVTMFGQTAIARITAEPHPYTGPLETIHFSDTPRGSATDKAIQFVKDAIM